MPLENLFWDSCVFIRYLIGDDTAPHYTDISRFIGDAKSKKRKIYFSTLTFSEMRQEFFKGADYGSIREFFADLGASFIPIEPSPNILIAAGELRSAKSTNPGDPNPPAQRSIATPDAILLATALFAKESLGIEDIVFHTTDEGKGKNWYGRSVPIIGFERWYPEATRTDMVKRVCNLAKEKPIHPEPTLEGIVKIDDYRHTSKGA
jgi:predicted nucleic acid-binding protein